MYTLCPQCETAFKVTAEQLQAARGRVRCGKCSTVFNAVAHLSDRASAGSPKQVAAAPPISEAAVERRIHERRRHWAPTADADITPEQSSQTAVLAQFLSEPLAEPDAMEQPAQSNEPPPSAGDLTFDAAAEMTAAEADGSLADLSWLEEPEPSAQPQPGDEDRVRREETGAAAEPEADEDAPIPDTAAEPVAEAGQQGDELGLSDEDWDQLLFDDDHGIQEYLEEKKAKAQKKPPSGTDAAPDEASVTPSEALSASEELRSAVAPDRAAQPDNQAADDNFEQAVEELLTSLTDDSRESPAPADAAPQPEDEATPTADEGPAFSVDELSIVEEDDTSEPVEPVANDESAAPDATELMTLPPGEEVVMADENPDRNEDPDADAVEPSTAAAGEADDDPLSEAGSENYTFSLYHELEEQAASSLDDEGDRSDDQSDLSIDADSITGENPALTGDDVSTDAHGETEMLEFPLEEAVEFEIPIDEYGDNTTVMADDLNEAELAIKEQKTVTAEVEESLDVLDADLKPRRRAGKGLYWGGATLLLILVLAIQLAHYNRDTLVLHPTYGPWLQAAYGAIGMTLVPPGDLDQYDIRLHVAPAIEGTIQISATLSNKADHVQPYPLVRLVLEDRWQEPVGALIVEPTDYLAQSANASGLMAPRERVEAQIEVLDPGPDAQSYKLDVCLRHTQGRLLCADDS